MLNPLFHSLKPQTRSSLFLVRSFTSWPAVIRRASSSPQKVMGIYTHMHRRSFRFDSYSILFTLKSVVSLRNLSLISNLHSHIFKMGLSYHVYVATSLLNAYVVVSLSDAYQLFDEMPEKNVVTWNTMITGYSKYGQMDKAFEVFEAMPVRDVASWSALIAGYVNNGKLKIGLGVFREMMFSSKTIPDQVTVGSLLSACSRIGSVGLLVGRSVHGFMAKNMWQMNVEIGTALVEMYAKCGFLKYANRVFELMLEKNVMTWTALICGFAHHGNGREAIALFQSMQEMGVRPNEITFTGILYACTNSGLVDEGRRYFEMIKEYGLELRIHHFGCLVDLLGKAGLVEEAYQVIRKMRFEPNVVIWGSYLSACKEHRKFDLAERVTEQVLRTIRPEKDGGVYSLISELYVLNDKCDKAENLRKLMLDQNVRKVRGSSFVGNR